MDAIRKQVHITLMLKAVRRELADTTITDKRRRLLRAIFAELVRRLPR